MFNDHFSDFYVRPSAWFRDTPTRMAGLGRPFALSLFLRVHLEDFGWIIWWNDLSGYVEEGLSLVMDAGMKRWDLGFGLDMYR